LIILVGSEGGCGTNYSVLRTGMDRLRGPIGLVA